MEEFQDAIEDAQYITAIDVNCGPQPIIPWEKPTTEALESWKRAKHKSWEEDPLKANGPEPFGFEWTLNTEVGFFFFSSYLKDTCKDYIQINFIEEVIRWKKLRGSSIISKAREIVDNYLMPSVLDPSTKEPMLIPQLEISEYDLKWSYNQEERVDDTSSQFIESNSDSLSKKCPLGIDGPARDEILKTISRTRTDATIPLHSDAFVDSNAVLSEMPQLENQSDSTDETYTMTNDLSRDLFDQVANAILGRIKNKYWSAYSLPEVCEWNKTLNFLWYRDRPTVQEDFFVMRVLGRGGFGLVTACKKGTSGKLYAMKVMNKKRIKSKKAEQLCINEQQCLKSVESAFIVNLKYSFQSKDDIFLILDIMTGGDLNFHLIHRGPFNKKTCQYYAARILLGLDALHSKNYVYRDLKPENCLLAEDGRLKLSDLGLATVITPHLRGAAGTRGYWAPEMLIRDENGKKIPYDQRVDWFSFGCLLTEMISGRNPFRTEAAIKYGTSKGKETKEKAMDCATLEYDPDFDSRYFDERAADLCRGLLRKDRSKRYGSNGSKEIMSHPWFKGFDWDCIIADKMSPPFVPARDVNAASQSEIGDFGHTKEVSESILNVEDEEMYKDWTWTNPRAFADEVMEVVIYERQTGQSLVPISDASSCCCVII